MSDPPFPRVEINGHPARAAELQYPAVVNDGHFTAMQVRNRAVRGLELHLRRLDSATRELYGIGLDGDRVRAHIRHALGDEIGDASVRVNVFRPDTDTSTDPSLLVSLRPPVDAPSSPQRLQSVSYQRPFAHLKHAGTFAQIQYRRMAARAGFDEALLTAHDGIVSESAIANIGCYDGGTIIWPDAPALHGIAMQLIERALPGAGLGSQRSTVRVGDLATFRAVFLAKSSGISPVGQVDDLVLPVDPEIMTTLTELYRRIPWDPI
jgi:branched-subunit amino acid aminotransferase/4-amino-4-deoxychorismate lyase